MARVLMVGNFNLDEKGTMRARALPLARALVRRKHAVQLVLPAGRGRASREWREDGVSIGEVPGGGNASPATALRLARATFGARPHVVHAFKPIGYAGLVGAATSLAGALRLRDTHLVVDTDDWEGTGGWATLERRPAPVRWLVDRQERWTLGAAESVTVASRHLETLVLGLGVPRDRLFYVPNGAEPTRQDGATADGGRVLRLHLGLDDWPTLLLYTRFFEYPLSRVVRVFAGVVARVPEARLLVVGRGFHGEEDVLARLLAAEGLGARAHFAGWVEPAALPTYFAAADAALYPLADTMVNRTKCPAKLVELMAAGLPVVAEAVGQACEYVSQGESGLLVTSGDEAAFADALARVLLQPSLRSYLGRGAAVRVEAEFNWDRLAGIVENAYALAVTGAPSPSRAYD